MSKEQNKSFVLQEPGKVTYEDRSIPSLEDGDDVLVEVKYTGICGSDVHYYNHGRIGEFVVKSPMVLGHESAGVVHTPPRSSSASTQFPQLVKGARVAIEPGRPCRNCALCIAGRYNLCPRMRFAATPPIDGTLARFFVVPASLCYPLPDNVSLQEGALLEPASVAVHACRLGGVGIGSRVVVFGCGPVGLLCCAVARALGAKVVVGVDMADQRLKKAEEYAATAVFKPIQGQGAEDTALSLTKATGLDGDVSEGLGGADVVLEATGAESCIQTGVHVLKRGGVFIQVGLGRDTITFPLGALGPKEGIVKGCFRYGAGDYEMALQLVATGKLEVKSLITQVVEFGDAEKAFEITKKGEGIKILIAGPDVKVEYDEKES